MLLVARTQRDEKPHNSHEREADIQVARRIRPCKEQGERRTHGRGKGLAETVISDALSKTFRRQHIGGSRARSRSGRSKTRALQQTTKGDENNPINQSGHKRADNEHHDANLDDQGTPAAVDDRTNQQPRKRRGKGENHGQDS